MVKPKGVQAPTFLEGTPGFYVKRQSPPRYQAQSFFSSYISAPTPSKAEATGGSSQPTPRSLSGSTVSLVNPPPHHKFSAHTPMGASNSSTPALIASNLYASAASIATVGGISCMTPTRNSTFGAITNFSGNTTTQVGFQASTQDMGGRRRLSHTPIRPKRRAAPKHELSSHSFNYPANSYAYKGAQQQQQGVALGGGGQGQYSAVGVNSAAQGFPHTNIESVSKQFKKHNVSTSLQSLNNTRHQHMGSSILLHHQNSLQMSSTDPESELPLPNNWELEVTSEGIRYYVDHNNKKTHWIHPLAQENLLPGWIKIFDEVHGVVYYNDAEKRSQYEHPGLLGLPTAGGGQATPSSGVMMQPSSMRHSASVHQILEEPVNQGHYIEDLNIIDNTAVPEWVRMYSEAPFEADHLLNWNMFKLPQLAQFDAMLMKLYKQDAINTVIKYEKPRKEINLELARRQINMHS